MTVVEAILSHDMEDILNRMFLYAKGRLKFAKVKNMHGKEPFDFVQEVLCKSIEGKRNWDDSKCSFAEFLFGCLKSEISNYLSSLSSNPIIYQDFPNNLSVKNESVDQEIQEIIKLLKKLVQTIMRLLFLHIGQEDLLNHLQ